MKRFALINDDFGTGFSELDKFFSGFFPVRAFSYTAHTYDPQKFELKPKKEYVDLLLKELDDEITYHEGKIKELRGRKEELQKQG